MKANSLLRRKKSTHLHYGGIAILAFLLLILMVGCGSVQPPQQDSSPTVQVVNVATEQYTNPMVQFLDGSKIHARVNTEFGISMVAGMGIEVTESAIDLYKGAVLIKSQLPSGKWFSVTSPNGYIARVTGSIMVVTFNPETNEFIVDCIEGTCVLGYDLQHLVVLSPGIRGWLDANGNFQGPISVDMEALRRDFGADNLVGETVVPTETPTPLPTDTLAPGVPTPTPDLPGTATAACQDFNSKYPKTPCP